MSSKDTDEYWSREKFFSETIRMMVKPEKLTTKTRSLFPLWNFHTMNMKPINLTSRTTTQPVSNQSSDEPDLTLNLHTFRFRSILVQFGPQPKCVEKPSQRLITVLQCWAPTKAKSEIRPSFRWTYLIRRDSQGGTHTWKKRERDSY